MFDMTGLRTDTDDRDIIGEAVSGDDASLFQIKAGEHGTILMGKMTCLEAPLSLTDIDVYSATVSTGEHEDGIAALDETALLTAGGAWTSGKTVGFIGVPAADEYIYLVNGAADTADNFTAGKFLIEMFGFDA